MRQSFLAVSALLAIAAAGCKVERTDDTVDDATPEQPQVADNMTAPGATAGPAVAAADEVVLRTAAGAGGPYLTDAMHRALYLLEGDTDGSRCNGQCLAAWPPLLVVPSGRARGTPELPPDRIGTVTRADGAIQVTYNGRPLYRRAQDSGPGATTGQDVHDRWGAWYLVTPRGDAVDAGNAKPSSGAADSTP